MRFFSWTELARTLTATLLCLLLPGVDSAKAENIFLLRFRGNPYWQKMAQGIGDSSKRLSLASEIHFTSSESAAEEQANQCKALLQKKPRFLGIAAINTAVGVSCLQAASAQGAEVAVIDNSIPEDSLESVPVKFRIGSDNYQIGKTGAEYAAAIFAEPKVLILEGTPGSIPGTLRVRGFRRGCLSLNRMRLSLPRSLPTGT